MTDSFKEFALKYENQKRDNQQAAKGAPLQWETLKNTVSQFCDRCDGFDGNLFLWITNYGSNSMLVLKDVAASFIIVGKKVNEPTKGFRIVFSRKPETPGEVYIDESPLKKKIWDLELEVKSGEYVWFVDRLAPQRFKTDDLLEEIAKELARYYLEYEAKYGR